MSPEETLGGLPTESLVVAVTETVAERRGVEPTDLRPIHDVIDPDALNTVFEPAGTAVRNSGRVAFTYYGYEVRIDGDGSIEVEESTDERRGESAGG